MQNMTSQKYQLDNYRKFLLNRVSTYQHILDYVENCVVNDDIATNHTFHKIMVHNWTGGRNDLFDELSQYFGVSFIPVDYNVHDTYHTFYTSSLSLVMKIMRQDFMFLYARNLYSIDILFNDKSSFDLFENSVTIEDIVAGVIGNRLNENLELDLSNFCNDPELLQKKICFYKFNVLSQFKLLMLRIGKDARKLNLSDNKLVLIPVEILNFFIKGDLTAIDLSNNEISSLSSLQRISSKIEKLWFEGNPLCEQVDFNVYVKEIVKKYPRLTELDGIKINQYGILYPFIRNFMPNMFDRKTKLVVEKFLTLYFSNFDANRQNIISYYSINATLTVATDLTAAQELEMPHYANCSRNILHPVKRNYVLRKYKIYDSRDYILQTLMKLPETVHDPRSFTVDVLKHDSKCMILVIDGIFKEKMEMTSHVLQFRRTFTLQIHPMGSTSVVYQIRNELFNVSLATPEQAANFRAPVRNMCSLALTNPDTEDMAAICKVFVHLTKLNKTEAELRLESCNWDLDKALNMFMDHMKNNCILPESFAKNDDDFYSDQSPNGNLSDVD